jgi:hypothetical protein
MEESNSIRPPLIKSNSQASKITKDQNFQQTYKKTTYTS